MRLNVVPTDGMIITEDTHFARGIYDLPNGIEIGADNVTLDGGGAQIVSLFGKNDAIRAQGRKQITIRNLQTSGFYHGIRADDCADVKIEKVTIRNTAEIEGIDTFLYLWLPIEKVYSGAILLNNVAGGAIRACDLQHQMNGILLYGCTNMIVEDNNASFNSGWGIYLSGSNDNTVQRNQLDFCNRLFRRPEDGSIRVEADAAGIVLVRGSSRNRFVRNSCLCGGDGIFIAGYEHPGVITPCNDNLFEENDCRLSPNNAIESTFSKGNIFRRNDCSRSNYGFWLGFSWENILDDNLVEFSRWAGIAVEHGHDNIIRNNKIRMTQGDGVRLWTRGGSPVLDYYPDHVVSYNFIVENNLFESNLVGFAGYTGDKTENAECHDYSLRGNTFNDNRVGAHFARVQNCTVEGNTFTGNVEAALRLKRKPGVTMGKNTFARNAADVLEVEE
ncbi:MAG: right-handed parallel beta-helix repeat-containing protein [Chloroflexota bacterium]|nr:right-handed parallel beta-helix repeat-containing protein [Chloroflexota bacterium]